MDATLVLCYNVKINCVSEYVNNENENKENIRAEGFMAKTRRHRTLLCGLKEMTTHKVDTTILLNEGIELETH